MSRTHESADAGCRHDIEFVGGPFDGHRHCLSHDPQHLPDDLAWLVSENVFRLIEGEPHEPKRPITSVALYERQKLEGRWRYCFLGAVSAAQWIATRLVEPNEPSAGERK